MTSTADSFLDRMDASFKMYSSLAIVRDNPDFVDFSATPSANGGVDIETDSCLMHARNHLSVRHPLPQMLLFGYLLPDGRFMCHKSIPPKINFDKTEPSGFGVTRTVYVAGWILADSKTESPNAKRTPIFTRQMLDVFGYTVPMFAPYDCAMTADKGYCRVSDESTFMIGKAVVSLETDYQQQGMLAQGSHVDRLHVPMALELSCITTVDMEKNISSAILATPQSGGYGFFQHSANAKGNCLRKKVFTISCATNAASSLEGTSSTPNGGNHHREIGSASSNMPPVVILDSQSHVNCTGNFGVFSSLTIGQDNVTIVAANGQEMFTIMSGSVRFGRFDLDNVHYCPELGNRLVVSASLLDHDDYFCGYGRRKCSVTDLRTGKIIAEGRLINMDYILDYLQMPRDRPEPEQPALATPEPEQPAPVTSEPEQITLVSSVWNTFCSALRRLR